MIDAHSHPALFLVDGVSSIGALDFQMDDWKVDVAVTGSQKALSLPTGLALLCVSPKVREQKCSLKVLKHRHGCYLLALSVISSASRGWSHVTRSDPFRSALHLVTWKSYSYLSFADLGSLRLCTRLL